MKPATSCWMEQVGRHKRKRVAERSERVADEPVVVMNPTPMNAGNGREEKTWETPILV